MGQPVAAFLRDGAVDAVKQGVLAEEVQIEGKFMLGVYIFCAILKVAEVALE